MCKHLWISIGKVRLCKKCKLQLLSDGTMFIEVTKKEYDNRTNEL